MSFAIRFFFFSFIEGAIKKYIEVLLAGLGGGPHFISATILAIGRVLYEFKGKNYKYTFE